MFMRVNSKCAHQVRPPLRHELGGGGPMEGAGRAERRATRAALLPADLRTHCTEFVAERDAC
jgi:hypothetical protein